jgi:Flp pilus assembly protein TadD
MTQKQRNVNDATFAAALALHEAGRLDEAAPLYGEILRRTPRHSGSLNLLGVVASQRGQFEEAVGLIKRAIAIVPGEASYRINLGVVLREQRRVREAAEAFRAAVALAPAHAEGFNGLGVTLAESGQVAEARAAYERALTLRPDYADAANNFGNLLAQEGELAAAIRWLQRAVAAEPHFADAHNNLGVALAQSGDGAAAEAAFRAALALAPGLADAHYNLGMARLAAGDFAAGWRGYEWRWQSRQLAATKRAFAAPQWQGEPGEGVLLIHAEQGFGDTLQFCRYAADAAALGWSVLLEVPPALTRLLQRSLEGVAQIVVQGARLPHFDAHVPMMSLPLALGAPPPAMAAPYLCADPARAALFRRRMDPGRRVLRIGLCWAGNPRPDAPLLAAIDRRRSVPPEKLAPLLDMPGLEIYALQKGGPDFRGPINFMPDVADFADTAALIENLDLVISVDTAVAHLAAGMGKPVWLLNRFDSCWRWGTRQSRTGWYPKMRIFNQPKPGDWDGVVVSVLREIRSKNFQFF